MCPQDEPSVVRTRRRHYFFHQQASDTLSTALRRNINAPNAPDFLNIGRIHAANRNEAVAVPDSHKSFRDFVESVRAADVILIEAANMPESLRFALLNHRCKDRFHVDDGNSRQRYYSELIHRNLRGVREICSRTFGQKRGDADAPSMQR